MQSCLVCGSAFTRHRGGKSAAQKTCSRACGTEYRRQRVVSRLCATCGAQFETSGLSNPRFCSLDCHPKPDPVFRSCSECGQSFNGRAATCSDGCARQVKLRYDREYNRGRPKSDWDRSPRCCRQCTGMFEPTHVGQAYCDGTCSARANRARERRAGHRRAEGHRHRARKYGRKFVPIKPLTIFERDGWMCQICKKRVPKGKKSPHPLSPTLDHVIPMSCEGGDHVPENVRLAHHQCNSERGTGEREAVQLALIG